MPELVDDHVGVLACVDPSGAEPDLAGERIEPGVRLLVRVRHDPHPPGDDVGEAEVGQVAERPVGVEVAHQRLEAVVRPRESCEVAPGRTGLARP